MVQTRIWHVSQGVGLVRGGWWSRQWDGVGLWELRARRAVARRALSKIPERCVKGYVKSGEVLGHKVMQLSWGGWVGVAHGPLAK